MAELADQVVEGSICKECMSPIPDGTAPGFPRLCIDCDPEFDGEEDLTEPEDRPVWLLWFDGACFPKNPGGIATYGYRIETQEHKLIHEDKGIVSDGSDDRATNNWAEFCALGHALRWVSDSPQADGVLLIIRGDSELTIKMFSGQWRPRKDHIKKLTRRLQELSDLLKKKDIKIEAAQCPAGQNEVADNLSVQAYLEYRQNHPERNLPNMPYDSRARKRMMLRHNKRK